MYTVDTPLTVSRNIAKTQNAIQLLLRSCKTHMQQLIVFYLIVTVFCQFAYAATQVSQFGITWTFDRDYTVGQFANRDYWVVGPVTIIGIDPPSSEINGRTMNGSMVNINPIVPEQGYDSSLSLITYNSSLNVALDVSSGNPLVLQPHSSLVSSISIESPGNWPQLRTAAVLTVLAAPLDQNYFYFRPPYAGNDKTIKFDKNDLDIPGQGYSLLKNLVPVAHTPRLEQLSPDEDRDDSVERMFERPWIDHMPGWTGSRLHPSENMCAYGRDIANMVGVGALMLHLNFTNQQKEKLLIRYVQVGIDFYGLVENGMYWPPDGGVASGRKWPILFAGLMLNDAGMKSIGERSGDYLYSGSYGPTGDGGVNENLPPDYVHFGEDDQTFYVAAENIGTMVTAPYGGPTFIYGDDQTTPEVEQYTLEDIGLPEWSIKHASYLSADRRHWGASYRHMHNYETWGGFLLAAIIMEETASAKSLWNHDALFDYIDRQRAIDGPDTTKFPTVMWDTYRADYGCVWTRNNQTDVYSNGYNPCDSNDTIPPLPPTNLVSTNQTESSIALSWTTPSAASDGDTASGYRIFRDGTLVGLMTATTFQDTGLQATTSYNYQVYAVDDAGNPSSSAATSSFTTTDAPNPGTNVFYISPNGNVGNNGGDWNNALRQLPVVLERGAIYYVAAGDYSSYTFDDTASGTEYITIKKATLADHGTETGWQISYANQAVFGDIIFRTSYVIFDGQIDNGFKIDHVGAGGSAVDISNSDHITFKNSEVDGGASDNTAGACAFINIGGSYITVENCNLHNGDDDGIQIHNSDHIYIIGNEIYTLYGNSRGGCQAHTDGIEIMFSDTVEVKNNLIYDIRGVSAFITGDGGQHINSHNLVLENNIFYTPDAGFTSYAWAVEGMTIYNNIFWEGEYGGFAFGRDLSDMDVYNNVFYSINFNHMSFPYDPAEHRFGYNLIAIIGQGEPSFGDDTIINPDPQFENIPGVGGASLRVVTIEDFHSSVSSPCIDAGTTTGATYDIYGNLRPQGITYDIGPFEFTVSGSDTTPPTVPQNLTAQAVSESKIDLSWVESSDPESGVRYYKIYRDATLIDTTASTSYSDTGLTSNTTYSYQVSAVNGQVLESGRSNAAEATTFRDTTPPSIVSVLAFETSVEIIFNEPLDTISAEPNNYRINNGISVSAASLDTNTVTLTTSAHTEGSYTLTVVNVRDTSGNPMAETTTDYEYDEGLKGYWKFDDGSGNSALDSSGNGNTGSLINGPTWTTGKYNGGLSFNGVDNVVEIGTADLNSGAGTVALWSYAVSFASTGQYLFGHASQPWANRIQLYTDDQEGYLDLGLGNSHSTHTRIYNLDTQRWYHIALTWDGSNYTVYVDSSTEATGTYSDLSMLETYADIGNNGNRSSRTEAFNGIIDEVRTYNHALSATEILALYGEVPPADTNGPVISNIASSNITISGATITWSTDENSTSQVEYGLSTAYGNTTVHDTSLVTSHSVVLTGLAPSTIYHFHVKSRDSSGNESVSHDNTFTTTALSTYNITANDSGDGMIIPSGTTQVVHGGTQTYTITADTGYHIHDVLVDGISVGTLNSYTFTNVTANHMITASFAINTYTISASAGSNGQISPDGFTQINYGSSQAYTITADSGYKISDVLVDGSSIGAVPSYSFTNVTANHTIAASFAIDEIDITAPTVTNLSPQANSIQAPLNTLITLDITDSGDGVDAHSVRIKVNNNTVYSGNTDKYNSAYGQCYRTGTKADYTFIYQPNERFNFDQTITVDVNASDLAGNSMDEYSYSFQTKMRSFGKNKKVNKNNKVDVESVESTSINNNRPTTCSDSKGNIWATWHAGATNNKDIYINKLAAGSEAFGNSIKLTDSPADQCNPAIAVGTNDKLYVAWQDSRHGNWDIYVSTSTDGVNWSAETRVTDSNDNQYNPAIVVDSSNNVYIAWEDSRNGNHDIYIGASNNGFVSTTVLQITSDLAHQGEPAIAVDSDNTVYVVWTDTRNSKNDIYGAASNNGPWTNVSIVNNENNQSNPAIATESEGSILHLVWVDDTLGKDHIFYAKTSSGLPGSHLTGSSIIDDYGSSADQLEPAIAVTGSTGNNLRVFVCWQDKRWLSSSGDTDIFFNEINSGPITNVFVGDDETNSGQAEPALGIDRDGDPYIVWTDNRNMNTDIYYAGSTSIGSTALASGNISTTSTTTVETTDGVSVVVPAGAYPCEIEITISEVKNPPTTSEEYLSLVYDFGPSGIEFDTPVTITIPYEILDSSYLASAYWYNPLTAASSQQGITDIETIVISSTPYLRFKTTHFTQFFVGGSSGNVNIGVSGGGGGGGCSMSAKSQASVLEILLPYIGLTVTMVILKLKDRKKSKTRNIT